MRFRGKTVVVLTVSVRTIWETGTILANGDVECTADGKADGMTDGITDEVAVRAVRLVEFRADNVVGSIGDNIEGDTSVDGNEDIEFLTVEFMEGTDDRETEFTDDMVP